MRMTMMTFDDMIKDSRKQLEVVKAMCDAATDKNYVKKMLHNLRKLIRHNMGGGNS